MITTVLLDAGGVILDESEHEKKHAEIITDIISRTRRNYTLDDYRCDIGEAVRMFCPNVYHYVLWKNFKPNTNLFEQAVAEHDTRWQRERPPLLLMTGLADELKALSRAFEIGIAGQYGCEILDLLERESLLDLFSHRVTQDDFEITKPDPRYLEQICDRIGVAAKSCVMIGDRVDKDIIPAKQLGMRTIRIRRGLHRVQEPRTPDEFPDAELSTLKGLAGIVSLVSNSART